MKITKVYDDLITKNDLQWLGFNWLKIRVGLKLEKNKIRLKNKIFIEMINQKFYYFPSLLEIQKGICLGF